MKHEITFTLLSEYADNRCSEEDGQKVEAHIAKCVSCRRTLILLRNSQLAVRNLDRIAASGNFDAEFDKKLKEKLKLKEEKKLSYLVGNIVERAKAALLPPAPVLATVTASLLFFFLAYGLLTNVLVELPVIALTRGQASIYIAKENSWMPLMKDVVVAKGDIVKVAKGSFVDISHPDKYTMRIKENSEVTLARLLPKYIPGTTVFHVKRGKSLVSITEHFKGSKFIVKTPEATAKALGTEFLINVAQKPVNMTMLGVLEGRVEVVSTFKPKERLRLRKVVVGAGEATEVYKESVPTTPRQLLDKEWQELAEFYQIGKKSQVALLISRGKHRTRELLRPCALYISDVEPNTVSMSLDETVRIIDDAIRTKNRAKHLEGIKRLEQVLSEYPNPDYEPQLLLFIGSYYNYINDSEEAIEAFQKVYNKYPESTFASIALYAIAIVYREKLGDRSRAEYFENLVLERYPESPEAEVLRQKIVR